MDHDESLEFEEATVFGHRFRDLSGNISDLVTLEREGAIYSDFWDKDSQTFHYYRIRLLPREVFQYVESQLARQEFTEALETGSDFEEALAAVSDPRIRDRVRSYGNYGQTTLKDGSTADIRGCLASFWPSGMEALLCGQRHERYERLPKRVETRDDVAMVHSAINGIPTIRRFLQCRKHGRPPFLFENEYDTQDFLFCILRSRFTDALLEESTPKHAGSAKRVDIVIPSANILVEVKHIRDRTHAREVGDELRIDIESYHAHQHCKWLIAFVHDPGEYIVDREALMRDLSGHRRKGDSEFEVEVLVR